MCRSPCPGADYVLCTSWDGPTTESFNLLAVSLKNGSSRVVLRAVTEPRLIAPDRLLFTRGTTVMTVGFDPVRGTVVGEPRVAIWRAFAQINGRTRRTSRLRPVADSHTYPADVSARVFGWFALMRRAR
jgi:hypothetical protein